MPPNGAVMDGKTERNRQIRENELLAEFRKFLTYWDTPIMINW